MSIQSLTQKLDLACRIAKSYFDRGMGVARQGTFPSCTRGKYILLPAEPVLDF